MQTANLNLLADNCAADGRSVELMLEVVLSEILDMEVMVLRTKRVRSFEVKPLWLTMENCSGSLYIDVEALLNRDNLGLSYFSMAFDFVSLLRKYGFDFVLSEPLTASCPLSMQAYEVHFLERGDLANEVIWVAKTHWDPIALEGDSFSKLDPLSRSRFLRQHQVSLKLECCFEDFELEDGVIAIAESSLYMSGRGGVFALEPQKKVSGQLLFIVKDENNMEENKVNVNGVLELGQLQMSLEDLVELRSGSEVLVQIVEGLEGWIKIEGAKFAKVKLKSVEPEKVTLEVLDLN